MPAPGFAAYCEVSAETFALTMACITAVSFVARCVRSAAPVNLSGLGSSLLTAFYSLYGLTYWFNGIGGYNCRALATVTSFCLSISNGLVLTLLFIKADGFNATDPRWKRFRWVGLILTASHWGTIVASDMLVTALRFEDGLDGPRCESSVSTLAFQLKWIAQLFNELFQAAVFVYPLRTHLASAARPRFKPSKRPSNWILFRNPLWRGVTAVSCAATVTLVIAAFLSGRVWGGLPNMPIFAVEALHNAVNVAAILFAVDVHEPKSVPKRPSRFPAPKLVLPPRYRSRMYNGGGYSAFGYHSHRSSRASGMPSIGGRELPGRVGATSRGMVMPLPPTRRYSGSMKQLPPVADMSPESVPSGCSPSGEGARDIARSRSTTNALFFANQPAKKKWVPPIGAPVPKASSGPRRLSRQESLGAGTAPRNVTPTSKKVAPRRPWPPPAESAANVAERWGLQRLPSTESVSSTSSDVFPPPSMSTAKAGDEAAGFQPERIIEANKARATRKADRVKATDSSSSTVATQAVKATAIVIRGGKTVDGDSVPPTGDQVVTQAGRSRPAVTAGSADNADSLSGDGEDVQKAVKGAPLPRLGSPVAFVPPVPLFQD